MKNKIILKLGLTFIFILIIGSIQNPIFSQSNSWQAPASADNYKNPFKGNEKATREGKKLYGQFCAICHGKNGKGDGMAGMGLNPRPANFTKDALQKQTDGVIYWKMTEGKPPMAAYKDVLTEQQRWQLVNFIRSLD